jgi:hypothetical protein
LKYYSNEVSTEKKGNRDKSTIDECVFSLEAIDIWVLGRKKSVDGGIWGAK